MWRLRYRPSLRVVDDDGGEFEHGFGRISGIVQHTLDEHKDWVRKLCLTVDGAALLASCSDDLTVRFWSLEMLREIAVLHITDTAIADMAFTNSGKAIVIDPIS